MTPSRLPIRTRAWSGVVFLVLARTGREKVRQARYKSREYRAAGRCLLDKYAQAAGPAAVGLMLDQMEAMMR